MDQILDNMLISYHLIKSRYQDNMPLDHLEKLVADLREHNENFQKALDINRSYKGNVKVLQSIWEINT